MSLQFILGGSGTGKSHYTYEWIIREAYAHPDVLYYIIVPEQFNLQTQKTVVQRSPGKGILNIDVLSFQRLAFRVFEETGGDARTLLDDLGKSMILRKIAQEKLSELPYLGGQMKRAGYLDEVKSLISEFMQYEVKEEDLEQMMERAGEDSLLFRKLKDLKILYREFRSFLGEHYTTSEEVMDVLAGQIPQSKKLKDSVILFDGFTGFTPVQGAVIRELLTVCRKVLVTVTMDAGENLYQKPGRYQLFSMSKKMISGLLKLTQEVETPVLLYHDDKTRFCGADALCFLEEHLFRYQKVRYEKAQDAIRIYEAASPQEEMAATVRRIARLTREEGIPYGEMAIISGNLEEYGSIAGEELRNAGIPYFLDETHSILMNPMVEYMRSALDMVRKGFSYDTVFRYLRCSMSEVTQEETDQLENYVLAMGIRGWNMWKKPFMYTYRSMDPEQLPVINQIREKLVLELQNFVEGFSADGRTMEEYCRTLYDFLKEGHTAEKLQKRAAYFGEIQEKALEKEYEQIYDRMMELLERMVEILGEEPLTREEFVQILETGLSKVKIALIPPGQDQILVGDMERTRLKDIKALFFVGVNEGNIPKESGSGGILSEMDREFLQEEELELAPDPKEQLNNQRFYLYLNLTKPTQYLTLSYPRSNSKGEPKGPAYLIHIIKEMFPDAERESERGMDLLEFPEEGLRELFLWMKQRDPEEEQGIFEELYSWYLRSEDYSEEVQKMREYVFFRKPADEISKAVAGVLYGDVSRMGATSLERYASCAFAHFLQYGLRLTERAKHEFRAMEMGSLIHGSLELFAEKVKQSRVSWGELPEEQREQLVEESLQEMLQKEDQRILKEDARKAYTVQRTRRLLLRTAWALQQQLKNGSFEPEGFEVSVSGSRIDRMDVMEESGKVYVKVIDYKSGSTSFDLVSLYYGEQLQLAVYMDGALQMERKKHPEKEVIPAGIFYYNVKDPLIEGRITSDLEELEPQLIKELKMNGLVLKDAEIARKIDDTLDTIPAKIKKDGEFSERGSSLATREEFELLNTFIRRKIAMMRKKITEGKITMSPEKISGGKDPCEFCLFSTACGFDLKIPDCRVQKLEKLDTEEIFRRMREEVEDDGDSVHERSAESH